MAEELFKDDGTLACLGITKNERDKKFTCKEEQQSNLVNKTFWVLDYFAGVNTKYGERYIFKIKFDLEDEEGAARKVWTGSSDIQFILDNALRGYLAAMREELAGLHLEVKGNWQIYPVEARGVDFLGFVFRHGYVRLRKRIKHNIFRALKHAQKVCKTAAEIRLAVASYTGWLKYTNSINLTNKLNDYCYGKVF